MGCSIPDLHPGTLYFTHSLSMIATHPRSGAAASRSSRQSTPYCCGEGLLIEDRLSQQYLSKHHAQPISCCPVAGLSTRMPKKVQGSSGYIAAFCDRLYTQCVSHCTLVCHMREPESHTPHTRPGSRRAASLVSLSMHGIRAR